MATIAELFELALRYHQSGDWPQAENNYRQIIQADPNHAGARLFLGVIAHQTCHPQAALELMRQAIALNPLDADFHYNFGNILTEQGRLEDAIACYQRTVDLDPLYAKAHSNLGFVRMAKEQRSEALESFREALRIDPTCDEAYANMGLVLMDLRQLEEAAGCFRQVLRYRPHDPAIYLHLGHVLAGLGKEAEAAEQYAMALRLPPNQAKSRWNRALLRLLRGDFESGWLDYEFRWGFPGIVRRHLDWPRWDGSLLAGKTILLHAEQGLGDTLQFIRYAPLVKRRGGTVLLECQPGLTGLLDGCSGVDQVVVLGSQLPPFDCQASLLSLPGIFGTSLDTIPAEVPYLVADSSRVKSWRSQLAAIQGFRVGICWQGNISHKNDCLRSVPLTHFGALIRMEEVCLVSLQVGPGTDQLVTAPFPVTDLGNRFDPNSLEDLAAVMMNLDLVVSVDTAVAHLAGALAVPVWTLLPIVPDWRWLLDRSDSPWYSTMRLFRQSRVCDWGGVCERVAAEVCSLVAAGRSTSTGNHK